MLATKIKLPGSIHLREQHATTDSFNYITDLKSVQGLTERREAAAELKEGLEKEVLKAGNGPKPVRGQSVTVHCTGFGKNGDLSKKFWSTKDPGQTPFTFKIGLGSVIKGWDEGVMGMQVGEVARLRCSPDYGYGPSGFPSWGILPNSVLVFEIEVLSLQGDNPIQSWFTRLNS